MSTKIRAAFTEDLKYIKSLAKKEHEQLGFVPLNTYMKVIEGAVPSQTIIVADDDGDLTGFLYGGVNKKHARIFQICIQSDARRWYRASLIVQEFLVIATKRMADYCTCRVAIEIEAVHFWLGTGFVLTGKADGKKGRAIADHGRPVYEFFTSIRPQLFEDQEFSIEEEVTVQGVQTVQMGERINRVHPSFPLYSAFLDPIESREALRRVNKPPKDKTF